MAIDNVNSATNVIDILCLCSISVLGGGPDTIGGKAITNGLSNPPSKGMGPSNALNVGSEPHVDDPHELNLGTRYDCGHPNALNGGKTYAKGISCSIHP